MNPTTTKLRAWDSYEMQFSKISSLLILPMNEMTPGSENMSTGGGIFNHACFN